jgi:hypothetical protein
MQNELSKHHDTGPQYQLLDRNLKKAIDKAYAKHDEKTSTMLSSMLEEEEVTSKELLQGFLLPSEELVPGLEPLSVDYYSVCSLSDRYDPQKYLDSDRNLEMYLTDKRLLLVRAGQTSNPILDQPEQTAQGEYRVGCTKADSYSCTPFPLNSIFSISFRIENEVSSQSRVKGKGGRGGLIAFGILLLIGGTVMGVISKFKEPVLTVAMATMGLVGLGLIIAGIVRNPAEVSVSKETTTQGKWLRLAALDPIYMTKSSVNIEINADKHTAKSMANWVKELQNRCEAIRDPKVFEKRLVA